MTPTANIFKKPSAECSDFLISFQGFFPTGEAEIYALHHNDLNANRILVDKNGDLTGVWNTTLSVICYLPE